MRQVDGFVAAFVKEEGIAADDAARILILLEELLTNLRNMVIRIGRSREWQKSCSL